MARDARQDGRFVFAVRTTGIYCRPSCPSRRPRRDSVEFYANPNQAERAGYRACLRCKPTEVSAQAQYVTKARQLLDTAEGIVTLAELSKRVGLSPFHLQRLFKRATGLSPREYRSARRIEQVKSGLRKGDDVTTALYDAGFGSPSRLYEKVPSQLGMTPGEYRRGGSGAKIRFTIVPTPLGRMLVAATDRGLCAVRFGESVSELDRDLRQEFHAAELSSRRCCTARICRIVARLDSRRPEHHRSATRCSRHCLSAEGLGDAAADPARRNAQLHGSRLRDWLAGSSPRGGPSLRFQSGGDHSSLPSRGPQRRRSCRISLGDRAQEETAGKRAWCPRFASFFWTLTWECCLPTHVSPKNGRTWGTRPSCARLPNLSGAAHSHYSASNNLPD